MKLKITALLILLMLLSGCVGENPEPEIQETSPVATETATEATDVTPSVVTIQLKSDCEQLESIAISNGTLLVYKNDSDIYDFIYIVDGKEEQAWSVTLGMAHCVKHFENDTNFLIVYGTAMGHGCPANIVTVIDGSLCVLSEYSDSDELPRLYYDPNGKIICKRSNGVTIGSNNAISYYWDSTKKDFFPYEMKEIGLDELKSLDKENIVPAPENALSIYRRDNGLVHVNYSDVIDIPFGADGDDLREKTVSRTYVETENGLREYDYEADTFYGFFLECIAVTE